MPLPIEDYAIISNRRTAALVGIDGSIDWLSFPRFDSPTFFAALLGDDSHGRWRIAPQNGHRASSRKYLDDSVVLVTRWETEQGIIEVTDLIPHQDGESAVIRRVKGIKGQVAVRQDLTIRFDYATALPWVRQAEKDEFPGEHHNILLAQAGPDSVIIRGPKLTPQDDAHYSEFEVQEGETVDIILQWHPSHQFPPQQLDANCQLRDTLNSWRHWAEVLIDTPVYTTEVRRSLLTLRALTHRDTGGIVAAATTSLPENIGGERNWDYRYVWLRDAALTLQALMPHGLQHEVRAWREWLTRAIAGDPADIQIMYGLGGERRLEERELDSLPGYLNSAPVRVGNGAYTQFQSDIFGEVMLALDEAREIGASDTTFTWELQKELLSFLTDNWQRKDNGIWEIRGPEQHFTQSRAMIWAAFDAGIRGIETYGLDGPLDEWKNLRTQVREEIETHGFNKEINSYTQHYGTTNVDASLLHLAQIGYISYDDPKMLGTVTQIEQNLLHNGLLLRYRTESGVDGLSGNESPFLACSFWLVEQYAASGRLKDATTLMDRLVNFSNDLGLLSEEYDTVNNRQIGNFPQALSHLALVRAADAIAKHRNDPTA